MKERKRSPITGAPVPEPMFSHPAGDKWLKENCKSCFTQTVTDDDYLMMFAAGLDPWLHNKAIGERFPEFNWKKIRRLRRLTYSPRIDQHIRDVFGELGVPQEWYRTNATDPNYRLTSVEQRKKYRRCPSKMELADLVDKLRVDGKTINRSLIMEQE